MTEYDESVLRGNKKLRVAQEPTTGELSVVTYGNTAKDGSGTYYIVLLDSDGKLAVRPLTSADIVTVQGITNALPAGDNNIGNVDIVTLPTLPAGTNLIGRIDSLEPRERSNKTLMFEDNFETTKVYWTPGAGEEFTHSTTQVFQGEKAGYIANSDSTSALVELHLERLASGLLSIEMWWLKDTNLTTFVFELMDYDGTNYHRYSIKYDEANNKWQYRNSAANYADVSGGGETIINNTWCFLRIVLDITNGEYETLQTNYLNINLGDIDCYSLASAVEPYLRLFFYPSFANGTGVYVDNVKIYKNEI